MGVARAAAAAIGLLAVLALPHRAECRTLLVGPGRPYPVPSAAARAAADGDRIEIAPVPGGYYDCAAWNRNRLTIEGEGGGALITDTTCQGKAIFVTAGRDITIRNLTFARARVPDGNGAGIRAEGAGLRVENSRFVNNESGILAAAAPGGTIIVQGSQFLHNGACRRGHCTGGILTGDLARLVVDHCLFLATGGGSQISSGARMTELLGNRIADGPSGIAAALVDLPDGGSLVMRGNRVEKGPWPGHANIAVRVAAGFGAKPVGQLLFAGNRVSARAGRTIFVSNWSGTRAEMQNNIFVGAVTPVSDSGYGWFRTKSLAHAVVRRLKALAHAVKKAL